MSAKPKIAVFASGNGSNFEALAKACQTEELGAEIVLMVTDKPDAYVCNRAQEMAIPIATFQPKKFESSTAFERAVLKSLSEAKVEWIVLAGYMRLLGKTIIDAYPSKIVNIHPSLLPSFPGKDAVKQAIQHGVKVTGVTVHLVDEGMDTGPIIAQQAVEVVVGSIQQTTEAIHIVEHELYKKTLAEFIS